MEFGELNVNSRYPAIPVVLVLSPTAGPVSILFLTTSLLVGVITFVLGKGKLRQGAERLDPSPQGQD